MNPATSLAEMFAAAFAPEEPCFGPALPESFLKTHASTKLLTYAQFAPTLSYDLGPSLTTRFFLGRPPPPLNEWFNGFAAIAPAARVHQVLYLREAVENWLCTEQELPRISPMGVLALVLLVDTGLWQDYAGDEGKTFPRATDFVRYYLELWALKATDTRISRRLSSGRLWLRLRGLGLPVPTTLSRLEHFGQRDDAIELYRNLVGPHHVVPTEATIKVALGLDLPAEPVATGATDEVHEENTPAFLDQVTPLAAKAYRLCADYGDRIPSELRDVITALFAACPPTREAQPTPEQQPTPKEKPKRPKRPKKVWPRYDATRGCPFHVKREQDYLCIKVVPLEKEWREELSKKARYAGWDCAFIDETTVLHCPFNGTNRSEVRAKVLAAKKWMKNFCERLKAPSLPPEILEELNCHD